MSPGPKRYTLRRFSHWRLVLGSLGGLALFAATRTWLVGRIAWWLR